LLSIRGGREKKVISEIKEELKKRELEDLVIDLKYFGKKDRHLKNYILCYCHMNEEVVKFFRRIPSVVGFVKDRDGELPTHVSLSLVEKFFSKIEEENGSSFEESIDRVEKKIKGSEISIGELVKIIEGPFINQEGKVSEIDEKKDIVRIHLSNLG
jgi:transcription antitermination factor NusG